MAAFEVGEEGGETGLNCGGEEGGLVGGDEVGEGGDEKTGSLFFWARCGGGLCKE